MSTFLIAYKLIATEGLKVKHGNDGCGVFVGYMHHQTCPQQLYWELIFRPLKGAKKASDLHKNSCKPTQCHLLERYLKLFNNFSVNSINFIQKFNNLSVNV